MKPLSRSSSILPSLSFIILFTCSQPTRQHHAAHAQEAKASSSNFFDPSTIKLTPTDPAFQAKAILQAGNPQAALAYLDNLSLEKYDSLSQGRILWLRAKAATQVKNHTSAKEALETLVNGEHPLKAWAALDLAELILKDNPQRAESLLETAKQSLPVSYQLRSMHVRALLASGQQDQALIAAKDLLTRIGNHIGGASFLLPLADALSTSEKEEEREQALIFYQRIASRAPLSLEGQQAEQKAKNLAGTLSTDRKEKYEPWPVDTAFEKANALYLNHAYEQAEVLFEELIKQSSGALQCKASYQLAKSQLARKARTTAAPLMLRIADRCKNYGYRDRALFNAAQAYSNLDDNRKARILYAKLEREFPQSNLADDARFRSALLYRSDKQENRAQQLLKSLSHRYPQGDMRDEAMFMLAWQAFEQKHYREALHYFNKLHAQNSEHHTEGMQGRSTYWLARSYELLKNKKQAITYYADVCEQWPMSFHCQWSLRRLSYLKPSYAASINQSFKKQPAKEAQFTFQARMKSPEFQRVLELFRVGESSLAQRELQHQGYMDTSSDEESLWLCVALFEAADAYASAMQLVRKKLDSLFTKPPSGKNWPLWRLSYPLAFSPLMEMEAAKQKVPVDLVRSIAREESSFEPSVVSVSRAYGLIQLISPTAKTHAEALGLPYTPNDLKTPEINLPIGIHFIKSLLDRYQDQVSVVPAAYNAGEGAVDRWLKSAPDNQQSDEWIESIPYSQSRRYSRRVLQSYGIYHWFRYGEFPKFDIQLPSAPYNYKNSITAPKPS
ncbi:MAG: transglycosylase SLT domain-containing protein [Myxococcales bacterium]|nr:MAG: transglycosylase SLT domain-containing protein [Myxococcales bacterium]